MNNKTKLSFFVCLLFGGLGLTLVGCGEEEQSTSSISSEPSSSEVSPSDASSSSSSEGHVHEYLHFDAVSPTCTQAGNIEYYKCNGCNKYFNADKEEINESAIAVAALGHDYGAWTVTKSATCTEGGTEQRVCSHDATHIETRSTSALNHDYGNWEIVKNPTCQETGLRRRVCSHDSSHVETEVLEKLAHTPAAPITENVTPSTCEDNGHYEKVIKCAVCGEELSRNTVTTNALGHDYGDWEVTTPPTCIDPGVQTRVCLNNPLHTQEKPVNPLGHNLVVDSENEFAWSTDGTTAKVNLKCSRSGCEYTDQVDALMSHETTQNRSCTDGEQITYTARYTDSNNVLHTDTNVVAGEEAYGHDYEFIRFEWDLDHEQATVVRKCSHDNTHTANVTLSIGNGITKNEHYRDANCTESQIIRYTATYEDHEENKDVEGDGALGHSFKHHDTLSTWRWDTDHSRAYIKYICENDNNHYEEREALVTSQAFNATCSETEHTVFHATYTDPITSAVYETEDVVVTGEIDPNNHNYTFKEFEWNEAKTSALAVLECSLDSDHPVQKVAANMSSEQKSAATCTAAQVVTYTATYGEHHASQDVQVGDPLGHNFEQVGEHFEWNETHTEATLHLACSRCDAVEDHVIDSGIGVTVNNSPTCMATGKTTYTATYGDFNDEVVVITPKLDHNYEFVAFEWDEVNNTCQARLICHNGDEHTEHVNATVTSVVTNPTCTAAGYTTYTATYGDHHENRVVAGPAALGHAAGSADHENEVAATCSEAGSYDDVVRCTRCDSVLSSTHHVVDPIEHSWGSWVGEHQEPTCTEPGVKTRECANCDEIDEVITPALGHDYSVFKSKINPTCTTQGYDVYQCSRCSETIHKNFVSALGHTPDRAHATCTEDKVCTVCHEVLEEALGHDYQVTASSAATCTEPGTAHYKCSRCDAEYDDNHTSDALGHAYDDNHVREEHIDGQPECRFNKVYTCTRDGCGHEEILGTVEHHNYAITIVTEANCQTAGLKRYTCTYAGCDYVKEEAIPADSDNHVWLEGEVSGSTRTDTCKFCSAKRTVTVFSGTDTSGATAEDLKGAEIALSNATLKIDDSIINTIQADAGAADVSLNVAVGTLNEEQKAAAIDSVGEEKKAQVAAQIGDNPIYDFNMTAGESKVTSFGEKNYVTVTLPYVLGEDENVDDIAVWFISDSGELTSIKAEYSNGFITFKTNHFSYYTVTRLTPAERCALYDHNFVVQHYDGDCEHGAYDVYTCVRCHRKEIRNQQDAPGHHYEIKSNTPKTCTTDGLIVYECSACHRTYSEVLKATGHNYQLDEDNSVAPTCTTAGENRYVCSICNNVKTESVPALGHDYHDVVTSATCEGRGYTTHTCSRCSHTYVDNIIDPLGHDYDEDGWEVVTAPTCTTAGLEKRVCKNDNDHVETRVINPLGHTPKAAANENVVNPTCETKGSYDEVVRCETCNAIISSTHHEVDALGHEWGDWHTVGEATCTEPHTEQRECAHDSEHDHIETKYTNPTGHVEGEPFRDYEGEGHNHATCTEEGHYDEVIKCTKCNKELSRVPHTEPALGHNFGEWEITTEPTCTEAGEATRHCTNPNCEAYETKPVAALGHNPGEIVKNYEGEGHKHATCIENGAYAEEIYCTRTDCGALLSSEERTELALGHDYVPEFAFDATTRTATVTFTCEHDSNHVVVKDANVALAPDSETPVCTEEREVTYRASITFNGEYYYQDFEVLDQLSHIHGTPVIENNVAATCSAQGGYDTVIYCTVGGEEISREHITVNQLPHTYGTEVKENNVNATCEAEGGYDRVEYCNVCDHRHVIEHVTIDRLEHVVSKPLIENNVPATCQEEGHYDEVTYCSICGEELSRERHTVDRTNHTLGELEHDEHSHYYVCEECEQRINEEEHHYEKETIKAPTCKEGGVVRFTCTDCGYTFDNKVSKTTDHNFVGGVCTVCGKREGDCTHKGVIEHTIDLGSLGYCDGSVTYTECECGEYQFITEEGFNIGCNIYGGHAEEYTVIYEGKEYRGMKMTCPDCGFTYGYADLESVRGCHNHYKMVIQLLDREGKSFLDALYEYSYTSHYNTRTYSATYGECGTIIAYTQCQECKEITAIQPYEDHCHWTTITESEDVSDMITINRTIRTCKDCGLRLTYEQEEEILRPCITKITTRTILEQLEDNAYVTVLEASDEETHDGHDWHIDYQLVGETCKDGVNMTRTCSICGLSQHGYTESHAKTEQKVLDFSNYGNGSCHSTMEYRECQVCGGIDYFDYYNLVSRMHHFVPDTDKQSTQTDQYLVCEDCGIKAEMHASVVQESECVTVYYIDLKLIDIDGETFFDAKDYQMNRQVDHNYVITDVVFKNPEEGCTGGVSYTRTCTKCGESYQSETKYHSFDKDGERINITDKTTGRTLVQGRYYECDVCHQQVEADIHFDQDLYVRSPYETTIGGKDYTGVRFFNADNNIEILQLSSTYKEGCVTILDEYCKLSQNGEVIVEYHNTHNFEQHDYEYNVVFDNPEEGCTGGYHATGICKDCGNITEFEGNDHHKAEKHVDLSKYGACEGQELIIYGCDICGLKDLNIGYYGPCDFERGHETVDGHEIYTNVCRECGLSYTIDSYEQVIDQCHTTTTTTTTLSINGYNEISTRVEKDEHHQFDDLAYECLGHCEEDGVRVTGTCSVCQYKLDEIRNGHQFEYVDVNLSELGACNGGGYYQEERCAACDYLAKQHLEIREYNHHKVADEETTTVDGNGNRHEITRWHCEECGLVYSEESIYYPVKEKGLECYYEIETNRSVTIGGKTFTATDRHYGEKHFTTVTFDKVGTFCSDGIHVTETCDVCHETIHSEDYHDHIIHNDVYVDLGKFGVPNGELVYRECEVCKHYVDPYFYSGAFHLLSQNDYYEQGVHHIATTYGMDGSDITIQIHTYEEYLTTCKYFSHTKYYVYNDTELLYESPDIIKEEVEHEFVYSFDPCDDCENGYTGHGTCSKCNYVTEISGSYHQEFVTEVLDLSDYGCECGGNIKVRSCPCGERTSVSVNANCDFESHYDSVPPSELPDNVYSEHTYTYTCAVTDPLCGFKYSSTVREEYINDDSCRTRTVTVYKFGISEEHPDGLISRQTMYDGSYLYHKIHTTYDEQPDGQGGRINIQTSTCSHCGKSNVYKTYYDEDDFVYKEESRYNLENYPRTEVTLYKPYYYDNNCYSLTDKRTKTYDDGRIMEETYVYGDVPCYYTINYREYDPNTKSWDEYSDEDENENHIIWQYYNVPASSCSQDMIYGYYCPVCGEHSGEYSQALGHDFHHDKDKDCYVCSRCGLENATDASGAIILEDLSDDEYYRVGYAIRDNVRYDYYIVLRYDVEEVEQESVVTSENVYIYKDDSPRCYEFSKEGLDNYARGNLNIVGDYTVTFSFVPHDASGAFDYSITF